MIIRTLFVGAAAILIFFVTFGLVHAGALLLILFINKGSSGITLWILPFFASGMAAVISTYAAIKINDSIFENLPKRAVAITIFAFWAISCVFTVAISLVGLLNNDLSLDEIRADLVFIIGAMVWCVIVRNELWPATKSR